MPVNVAKVMGDLVGSVTNHDIAKHLKTAAEKLAALVHDEQVVAMSGIEGFEDAEGGAQQAVVLLEAVSLAFGTLQVKLEAEPQTVTLAILRKEAAGAYHLLTQILQKAAGLAAVNVFKDAAHAVISLGMRIELRYLRAKLDAMSKAEPSAPAPVPASPADTAESGDINILLDGDRGDADPAADTGFKLDDSDLGLAEDPPEEPKAKPETPKAAPKPGSAAKPGTAPRKT